METLLRYFTVLTEYGAQLDRVPDHGNAIGIYLFDPENNKLEVYWQTGLDYVDLVGVRGGPVCSSLQNSV